MKYNLLVVFCIVTFCSAQSCSTVIFNVATNSDSELDGFQSLGRQKNSKCPSFGGRRSTWVWEWLLEKGRSEKKMFDSPFDRLKGIILRQNLDFVVSETTLSDSVTTLVEEGIVQIPFMGYGIAVSYHVEGIRQLELTRLQLCGIFTGSITAWSQLGIYHKRCNKINVVTREDESITNLVFIRSLKAMCGNKVPLEASTKVKFNVGVGMRCDSGVAEYIHTKDCSIGYLGFDTALHKKLPTAFVENRDGKFVQPNPKSISASIDGINLNAALVGFNPNPAGSESYPIVNLVWFLAYRKGYGGKAKCIQKLFRAFLGGKTAREIVRAGYGRLSRKIIKRTLKAVKSIRR